MTCVNERFIESQLLVWLVISDLNECGLDQVYKSFALFNYEMVDNIKIYVLKIYL